MTSQIHILSRLTVIGGVVLAISGCTQPQPPDPIAASGPIMSPQTGSAQGMNTHNSEPMPSGMVMKNNGLSPGTSMSTNPNNMPRTGSEQSLNTHNSEPMPSGMVMKNNGLSPGTPMVSNPNRVPQTGSAQGLNTHNSEPMPSGMVMPRSPATY